MRVLYFASILGTGCCQSWGYYHNYYDYDWFTEPEKPYKGKNLLSPEIRHLSLDSPCYSGEHLCHKDELCVPEGQHLYECCDWSRVDAACRQGNRQLQFAINNVFK